MDKPIHFNVSQRQVPFFLPRPVNFSVKISSFLWAEGIDGWLPVLISDGAGSELLLSPGVLVLIELVKAKDRQKNAQTEKPEILGRRLEIFVVRRFSGGPTLNLRVEHVPTELPQMWVVVLFDPVRFELGSHICPLFHEAQLFLRDIVGRTRIPTHPASQEAAFNPLSKTLHSRIDSI